MDRSPGFGSTHTDLSRPIKTWFPFGSVSLILNLACTCNSPDRSTKSTRFTFWCSTVCKHRVSGSLSLPSRGSFHLSFTVLCTIGHWSVFSLGGWSPLLPTRFLVSRGTPDTAWLHMLSLTWLSHSLARFSKTVQVTCFLLLQSSTPKCTHSGLGFSGFARRYSRNHFCFLFLRLLRCFSSPGSLLYVMYWRTDAWSLSKRVSPFRHLRITEYVLLPAAFRSLSRLSSAVSA